MIQRVVLIILFLIGIVALLNNRFPNALQHKDSYVQLISTGLVLVSLILGLMRRQIDVKNLLTMAGMWLGIALVVLTGYSYRFEMRDVFYKVYRQVVPSSGQVNQDNSMTFYSSINGHFMIDTIIADQHVQFMLDTGASKVSLTASDAKRLGIDVDKLEYTIPTETANGTTLNALVTLDSIKVGTITARNISAYVSRENTGTSLLGMNFLRQLSRYEVKDDHITMWGN